MAGDSARTRAKFAGWLRRPSLLSAVALLAIGLPLRASPSTPESSREVLKEPAPAETPPPFSLHVEGTLTEAMYPLATPEVPTLKEYKFAVDVHECQWLIRLEPVNPDYSSEKEIIDGRVSLSGGDPDEIVAGSDSQWFYSYMTSVKLAEAQRKRGDLPKDAQLTVLGTSWRGPGTVPFAINGKLIALWFAFASHCYFKSETVPGKLPPLKRMADEFFKSGRFLVDAEWELLEGGWSLPGYIMTTNTVVRPNEYIEAQLRRDPRNTNSLLRVRSTMKLGQHTIPQSISVTNFTWSPRVSPEGVEYHNTLWSTLDIRVEKASLGAQVDTFVPVPPVPTFFVDITYWSNGVPVAFPIKPAWPAPERIREIAERRMTADASHGTRVWILGAALGLMGLVLWCVLRWKPEVRNVDRSDK